MFLVNGLQQACLSEVQKLIVTRISLKPADIAFQQPNTNRLFETGSVEAKLLKKEKNRESR